MPHPDWDDHYRTDNLPWDTGVPEPTLTAMVDTGRFPRGRLLEIGCGTGTNARYLASAGFDVTAIDVAPTAVERARSHPEAGGVHYRVHDILSELPIEGPFDAVFDRGVFHVFDDPSDRARFAARVAGVLRPGGVWLSLIGSTEGTPREMGPPRRTARDVVLAIEPVLELLELRDTSFGVVEDGGFRAWSCLSRKRTLPAQPATHR